MAENILVDKKFNQSNTIQDAVCRYDNVARGSRTVNLFLWDKICIHRLWKIIEKGEIWEGERQQ